jgi:hypothetical protein
MSFCVIAGCIAFLAALRRWASMFDMVFNVLVLFYKAYSKRLIFTFHLGVAS